MNAFRPKPMYFPWPPVIYAVAIIAAYWLGYFSPLAMPDLPFQLNATLGVVVIGFALIIDIWALVTLWSKQTTVLPHRSVTRLVTNGPFQFTRNPIYLGYTCLTVGLGLVSGNAWLIVLVPVAAAVTQGFAIKREELHLLSRFGFEFELYCQKTRRWI